MNCPVCNGPLKIPPRAKQYVGRCPTCKAAFRATRFEHSIQIERLASKNLKEAEAIMAGRDEAPAAWRWAFRLAAIGLLVIFGFTVVSEIRASFEAERRLSSSGRITTAKVYSPYSYLPGPTDTVELTYAYEAGGICCEGAIRSDELYREPSFEIRTKGVKVAEPGKGFAGPSDEPINYAGVLTVTYLPTDPDLHRVGIIPKVDLRRVKARLGVTFLGAFMGLLLWWFSFRLGKIPTPKARA